MLIIFSVYGPHPCFARHNWESVDPCHGDNTTLFDASWSCTGKYLEVKLLRTNSIYRLQYQLALSPMSIKVSTEDFLS